MALSEYDVESAMKVDSIISSDAKGQTTLQASNAVSENVDNEPGLPATDSGVTITTSVEVLDAMKQHTENAKVRTYLRQPIKAIAKTTVKSLHPKDWILFAYFLYSLPLLFIGAASAANVVWFGLVIRMLVTPFILFFRYYLAVVPDDVHKRRALFKLPWNRELVVVLPYLAGFVLDIVHILCAVYFYTEEGAIIKNMYSYPADFFDDRVKAVDHAITGVSVEEGVGHYLRGLTGHGSDFNRGMGEYLSMCYVFFYIIIASAYVVPYLFATRYVFSQITTALVMAYLLCMALFTLLPTAGPYWQYPNERPTSEEVGYFWADLSHKLLDAGSSIGTALPSSHCAITTATWVVSLIYMWPLGLALTLIAPAIVVSTVWLGNHYLLDSIVGVAIGLVVVAVTVLIGKFWLPKVQEPLTGDNMYMRTMVTAPKRRQAHTTQPESASVDERMRQMASGMTLEEVYVDVDQLPAVIVKQEKKVHAAEKPAAEDEAPQHHHQPHSDRQA